MNKIIKFLTDNNIEFENNKSNLKITLDKNLEFINDYGDKIKYDNYISINNKYSYNPYNIMKFQDRRLIFKFQDGKQNNIIDKLKILLNL